MVQHFIAAIDPGSAVPLWRDAANLALRRLAVSEAISHLEQALALTATMAAPSQRDGQELELRMLQDTAWVGSRGWQAEEARSAPGCAPSSASPRAAVATNEACARLARAHGLVLNWIDAPQTWVAPVETKHVRKR